MSKGIKIALITAGVMIALGLMCIILAGISGQSVSDSIENGGLTMNVGSVGLAFNDKFNDKDYTVCADGKLSLDARDIKSIDLSWISGSISVSLYDGDKVTLSEESSKPLSEGQRMRYKLKNGELSVVFCANGQVNVPDKALTVLIPRSLELQTMTVDATSAIIDVEDVSVANTLSCGSTSGDISLSAVSARKIDADSTSGEVRCDTVSAKELEVSTTSGSVIISGQAEDIKVSTVSGKVTAQHLTADCAVDCDTGSGSVRLSFDGVPSGVDVDTISGDVTLALPKGTAIDLDFDSVSGKLKGSYNVRSEGVAINVDTTSGDLEITDN